jgi:hypothetical protein
MRKDYRPLTAEAVETIWMYIDYFMELFGEETPPRVTKEGLRKFCHNYEERLMNGYNEFKDMPAPL